MSTPTTADHAFLKVEQAQGKPRVVLSGDWIIANAEPIEHAVRDVQTNLRGQAYEVEGQGIAKLDTSGALLLKTILPENKLPSHLSTRHRELLEFLPPLAGNQPSAKEKQLGIHAFFCAIGRKTLVGLHFLWAIIAFIGEISIRFWRNLAKPSHFRVPSIVRHIEETGLDALSIVGLLAVMISMVITYQGALQLKKLGAGIFTVDLTVIALLREMGVLVTAIMVAGRSGSAFAAEIGVMKLRDEISALKTMGMDPIEVLVLPRVIALVVTLPILTFLADVIGLAGASVMAKSLLNISFEQYVTRLQSVATPTTFFVGIIKAPVFALLIAVIGGYQGLNVSGSAESIGKMTTLAVVQSIFIVITVDAFFSVVFSHVGI